MRCKCKYCLTIDTLHYNRFFFFLFVARPSWNVDRCNCLPANIKYQLLITKKTCRNKFTLKQLSYTFPFLVNWKLKSQLWYIFCHSILCSSGQTSTAKLLFDEVSMGIFQLCVDLYWDVEVLAVEVGKSLHDTFLFYTVVLVGMPCWG